MSYFRKNLIILTKKLFAEFNEKKDNLIWIDLEMTGLDTENDKIIEIAVVVTDKNLSVLKESNHCYSSR